MVNQTKYFLLMAIILVAIVAVWGGTAASGEEFIPPVPDKSKILPANDGGNDGCDSSRFKCVMGGEAVLDNQTGLIWARNASIVGKKTPWEEALKLCEDIEIGGKKGWRIPTRDELITLVDSSQSHPALPEGHPFLEIKDLAESSGKPGGYQYWTSTELKGDDKSAWLVSFHVGFVMDSLKLFDFTFWPVRDSE